ncbi:tail length tape-measure protein [Enterococcus phage Bp29]|uniref:Tail length tape-measure protein n=1 Tax=Enterococcus phage vB_EfaS-DELF1 TaxID=2683673 RepID=A0A5S9MM99_9CAUD|nr:tail length tape-measure protein [Enterococcus phage Bp29]BBQ04293.1 tail length tape-measure protein [Enterococcus phage vB_EfaS-DELF1]
MADKPVGNMKFGIGFDGLDESLNTLDKLNRAIRQTESAMKTNISTMDKANKTAADYAQQEEDLAKAFELQAKKIQLLEKRKAAQIEQYGKESSAVAKTNNEINKASAVYNKYSRDLEKASQGYIIASSGVDKYNKALSENEKQMKQEVSALKSAGDKTGAYAAQKKGLEKQASLTTKAIAAQENVVKVLTKEYGANSKQVQDAQAKLDSYRRQQTITSKQIEGTNKSIREGANSFKGLNDEMGKSTTSGEKAVKSLGKVTSGLGSMVAGIGKVVGKVGLGALLTIGNKAIGAVSNNLDGAIKRIDTLANSTRAFENMGFSADHTAKAMKNISKAIDGLPTALNDSVSNVQLLAASTGDLDLSVDVYKALNDAILGFGGDANMANNAIVQLSQSFSNGKIDAQTWNSMINSGLGPTLNALAKTMGKTTGELKEGLSEGKISVKEFQEGLIKLDKEGGGGLKSLEQIVKDSTKGIGTSLANAKTAMVRGTAELIKSADQVLANMNLPTIAELISNSGKKVENVMKAVAAGLPELAKNFSWVGGVFSTIGDLSGKALVKVGEFVTNFKNSLGGLIDYIGKVWSGKATNGDQYILAQLGFDYETIWKLEDFTKQFKEKADLFGGYIQGFWKLFSSDEATSLDGYSILRQLGMSPEAITTLETNVETVKTTIDTFGDVLKKVAEFGLHAFYTEIEQLYNFFIEKIAPEIMPMLDSMTGSFDRLGKMFESTSGKVNGMKVAFDIAFSFIIGRLQGLWTIAKGVFIALQIALEVFAAVFVGIWQTLMYTLTGNWSKAWDSIKLMVKRVGEAIWLNIKDTFLGKIVTTLWDFFTENEKVFTGVWDTITGILFAVPNFVFGIFEEVPKKIVEAINNGKSAVVGAFKGVFNAALKAIGKPVNGIIKGASWVLEKLGGEPLKEWDVSKYAYANGTPEGGHPINGPMMVNDGRGAETVITPDGRAFIPKGRNVVLNAPKGTHVLTAEETAQLQGSKAPKYRYKKGTNFFGKLWSNVKGFAGNVGSKLKNVVGDVWDFVSNPEKLAKKVLGGLDVLGGLTKYPLDVGKGILSKATSALTSKITEMFSASSGNLDLGTGTAGVYKYLADVAKSVLSKYPGFQITSGYRPGDPHSHGKRNAIDIALPGVTGGSPRYAEAANYAFEKFAGKVGYVITNGKVRDRSGQSGTGIHNDWRPWPDGDHYDHVHINGIKDPQNTQISGENIGGSGVDRWRGVATQALKMTGQYSASNLAALLNQMRTESNGNPTAINNWDINALNGTPSKGLLQVIDPTFRQYAMPGHNTNIFDPLSNILASIRYALSRYGSLTNAYRGVGYENGGIITKQHMALVGEGNKEEVVIPLTGSGLKRSRAMQLLAYASEKLGASTASISSTAGNTSNVSDMAQMLVLMQEQNQLLMAILAKDTNVVLDGTKLNSKLESIRNTQQINNNRNMGLI